eukprot:jgi/Mesen1/2591/ME000164S01714
MSTVKKGRVLIGGKGAALTPEDVFNVCSKQFQVLLDTAGLDKLAKGPGGKVKDLLLPDSDSGLVPKADQGSLSYEEVRAVVLVRLIEVMHGQGHVRPDVSKFFSELLNSNVPLLVPACDEDHEALQAVAASARSLGSASSHGDAKPRAVPLLEAFSKADPALSPPGLSADEQAALAQGMAGTVGVASIAVHAGQSLSAVSDAVSALSCEALQADVTAFDAENNDQAHSHKSHVDVASDLRSLLALSKLVNPRKDAVKLAAVMAIPQVHGPVRESLKVAASALRIELNSAPEAGAESGKGSQSQSKHVSIPSPLVANNAATLLRALCPLIAASVKRTEQMASILKSLQGSVAGDENGAPSAPDGEGGENLTGGRQFEEAFGGALKDVSLAKERANTVCQLLTDADLVGGDVSIAEGAKSCGLPGLRAARESLLAVDSARRALALEALTALKLLQVREAVLSGKQGGGPGKGKEAPGKGPPPVEADSAGEAQDKQGKKAPKAKEGKKGKGGGGAAALGKGTAVLKQVLDQAVGEAAASGYREQLAAVAALFDPRADSHPALLEALKGAIESNETRRAPKIAKGTRDFLPDQMAIRERAFNAIKGVFKRHGAVELDTPVFELRETLMGKYGEDSKLIYDLADQGGEILSLRYDLTVPFARYLAMHPLGNVKRYHIARVYRRDNPQMSRGRFREFYQCDFDIAGQYVPMIPDAEVLKVLSEILDELDIGPYEVKLNHRKLLDGMLDICGVPASKFRPICSAIDKLDKEPWDVVRTEMIEEKGLTAEVADKIGTFVQRRGEPLALLAELQAEGSPFAGHVASREALEELGVLFGYLQAMKCLPRFTFDLSLARGLDYYTGLIFEAVLQGTSQVGSIAAGGRYDNLVGMFSGKQVPAVGMSLGIERVFTIMEELERKRSQFIRSTETEVLVASIGGDLLKTRMEICAELWEGKVKAEFVFAASPNMQKQLDYANKSGILWMIIFGSNELESGTVKVKDLTNRTEEEVPRADIVQIMRERLGRRV